MNSPLSPLAVGLMLIAMSLIPLGDAAGKLLIQDFGATAFFVGWSRFLLAAIAALIGLVAIGKTPNLSAFRDWRLWLRGGLIGIAVATIVSALRTEPIANVFGAFFLGPIISYGLSIWLLGESPNKTRMLLMIIGFGGVLLVVRPGFDMTPGLGLAAIAGVFYGAYLTTSRWLGNAAPLRDLLFSQLLIAAMLLTPLGAFTWPEITPHSGFLIIVSAAASSLGNLLLILAYRRATAGQMAPFVYFQLVAATVFGLAVFGTFPDSLTLVGLALLCASGFATIFLKR